MRKILARPGRGLVLMCVTWLWLVHIELIKAKLRRFCKVRCARVNISELKQRRRWGQRERQKSNKFRWLKQQLCITPSFVHFLPVVLRLKRENAWFHVCRGRGHKTKLPFSFPKLWFSPLEFNSKKSCQHLTKKAGWNKRDKVWGSGNSPFWSDVFVAVASVNA